MKVKSALLINDVSVKAQSRKKQILKSISKVIDEGRYFSSSSNHIFKKNLESFLRIKKITLCGSGHDALMLSMSSLHLSGEDEVIFPVNAYPTAFPLALSNLTLVPCDVDENGQLDPDKLKKALTKKTKAIIIVHMYGHIGRFSEILRVAKQCKVLVIEDCAQSFGSKYLNKMTGSIGTVGCYSFYPTKNLGALGDGGAVATTKKSIYKYFEQAVSYGESVRYESEFVSFHSRIPSIQAAILDLYLKKCRKEFSQRKKLFMYYKSNLSNLVKSGKLKIIDSSSDADPIPHLFVIKTNKRSSLQSYLKTQGIETLIHYPYPIHLIKAFDYLGYKKGDFPMAEKLSKEILSLPFHSALLRKDIEFIIEKIQTFFKNN